MNCVLASRLRLFCYVYRSSDIHMYFLNPLFPVSAVSFGPEEPFLCTTRPRLLYYDYLWAIGPVSWSFRARLMSPALPTPPALPRSRSQVLGSLQRLWKGRIGKEMATMKYRGQLTHLVWPEASATTILERLFLSAVGSDINCTLRLVKGFSNTSKWGAHQNALTALTHLYSHVSMCVCVCAVPGFLLVKIHFIH